jgi:hypothetical protein
VWRWSTWVWQQERRRRASELQGLGEDEDKAGRRRVEVDLLSGTVLRPGDLATGGRAGEWRGQGRVRERGKPAYTGAGCNTREQREDMTS